MDGVKVDQGTKIHTPLRRYFFHKGPILKGNKIKGNKEEKVLTNDYYPMMRVPPY